MKKHIITYLLIFLFIKIFLFAQNPDEIKNILPKLLNSNNVGTEFIMGFHPNWEDNNTSSGIYIYVCSLVETEVRVTIPYFGDEPYLVKTTKPNEVLEFKISPSLAQPYSRGAGGLLSTLQPTQVWNGRGIIVESDDLILCYGFSRFTNSSDGFLALPTHLLGKEYIISSYKGESVNSYQSVTPYADIIGVYDNTKVSFKIGGHDSSNIRTLNDKIWLPYSTIHAEINRGDFWLIAAEGILADLGGSKVIADKPISVLSGNHCANIPARNPPCDYLIEQEIPIQNWGLKYPVANINEDKIASIIRVFCKETNTNIYMGGDLVAQMQENWGTENKAWVEVRSNPDGNIPTIWSGSKPINIVQYNAGIEKDNLFSDPFSVNVIPEEQFRNQIVLFSYENPNNLIYNQNYLSIIYQSDKTDEIPEDILLGNIQDTGEIKWTTLKSIDPEPGIKFEDPDRKDQTIQLYSKIITLPNYGKYILSSKSSKIAGYIYGQNECSSYGLSLISSIRDLSKNDNLPPLPTYKLDCAGNTIDDFTLVLDRATTNEEKSNLAYIYFNQKNSYNYTFTNEKFISGDDSLAKWGLQTIDPFLDAHAEITFLDRSGNDTTIFIDYIAVKLDINPKYLDFGVLKVGENVKKELTVKNSGINPVILKELILKTVREKLDDQGYKLDFSFDINLPILPGEFRTFSITFTAKEEGDFKDSVGVGDSCLFRFNSFVKVKVSNSIILVSDVDFGQKLVGGVSKLICIVFNKGLNSIAIVGYKTNTQSVFSHNLNFYDISPNSPLVLPYEASFQFEIRFNPDEAKALMDSIVFITYPEAAGDSVCVITGEGKPNSVSQINSKELTLYPNPATSTITLTGVPEGVAECRIYDVLGSVVLSVETQYFVSLQKIDISSLPAGVYFVRLGNKVKKFVKI